MLGFVFFIVVLGPFSIPKVQSLSFNISNFEDANIMYQGDASPYLNGTLALTQLSNLSFRLGRAIYAQPLHLKDPCTGILTHFITRFSFTIDWFQNQSPTDGFAFYLAPLGHQTLLNSSGPFLGLFNATTINGVPQDPIVAVEFDTWINEFDPSETHVGINNNSISSLVHSNFDIHNNKNKLCHVLITYNASTTNLGVSWSFSDDFSNNANNLSLQINLVEYLPEWVTVGFSSSFGGLAEEVVIHSWEFDSTLNSTFLEGNAVCLVNKYRFGLKVIIVTIVVAVICLVGVSLLIMKKKRTEVVARHSLVSFDLDRMTMPRRFDYGELFIATNAFEDERRLGQGGFGQVYKGILGGLGRAVAVKRIFADFENSERVFKNEVKIIGRLIHKNLVQFIGWCHEKGEFLLVFDYMPNGSLDIHLFGNRRSLAWDVRYKIALGVATALHYLHEDAEQCVLHRDIKSANVLLDNDFSTKLCDFGMAKLVDPRLKTQRTGVVGTYGYLAPEYINEGRASKKSDMYGFGVVALEIACGRRTYQDGEFHVPLTNWVWQLYVEGNILKCVDERLNEEFDVNEMRSLLVVGFWCTHPDDKERPGAEQVIRVLKQQIPLPMLPCGVNHHLPLSTNERSSSLQSSPITNSLEHVGR
ncbi:hypothetical protein RJT34_08938 [Clitoria ternatea]|uniref:non-specific serine/threonine protein kinase n=1 Tax=Clitoria ternatea TaxID=43366 RepID=A0AAN9K544_CLITE